MPPIHPDRRWWRRTDVLRRLTIGLWACAVALATVTGWANTLYLAGGQWVSWGGADWLVGVDDVPRHVRTISQISLVVVPWPVMTAFLVDFVYRDRAGRGGGWAVADLLGLTLTGVGLGGVVAGVGEGFFPGLPLALLLLGGAVLAIEPVTRWRIRVFRAHQHWSRSRGARTTATVQRTDVVTRADVEHWKVWLVFADASGREYATTTTIPFGRGGVPQTGDRYDVRYDPARPGRRATTYVVGAVRGRSSPKRR